MSLKMSQAEVNRYSRHLTIPQVGLTGQKKLKKSAVLVVGAGGLGSPIALYLAAAGVGRIGLVDDDTVEGSNLQRQVLYSNNQIGQPKVESARERLLGLNPHIQVDAFLDTFDSTNARQIADGFDILVDGSDNFPTRYLLNDLAVLTQRPYVYGSVFRFEGQISVFDAQRGACYRCLFQQPPPPDSAPSCAEGGVFGILPGTIGTLQATEVLKLILGIGEPLYNRLLLYDALDLTLQTVNLKKNPNCPVCGEHPSISDLIDYDFFCGVTEHQAREAASLADEITPLVLAQMIKTANPPLLIDVREEVESQVSRIASARHIPLEQLLQELSTLERTTPFILFCRTGMRSRRAARLLQSAGFTQVRSLQGGINGWVRQLKTGEYEY